MKSLIKFVLVLVILAVFAFSHNPTVRKIRTVAVEKAKVVFTQADTIYQNNEPEILK